MVIDLEIRCVTKADPSDPIRFLTHVGGARPDGLAWRLSEEAAIACIESRKYAFHVLGRGSKEGIIVGRRKGRKYLKAATDRDRPYTLLRLPECEGGIAT